MIKASLADRVESGRPVILAIFKREDAMTDNSVPTNDNDRASSSKSEQARSPTERGRTGSSASDEPQDLAGSSGRSATPGRMPLFRK